MMMSKMGLSPRREGKGAMWVNTTMGLFLHGGRGEEE